MLIYRLGGQFDAETFEGLDINLRQHDGGVNLAAAQFFELFQGDLCVFVGSGAHGQRDQNFIGVETVSYTHLDVYKRQDRVCPLAHVGYEFQQDEKQFPRVNKF